MYILLYIICTISLILLFVEIVISRRKRRHESVLHSFVVLRQDTVNFLLEHEEWGKNEFRHTKRLLENLNRTVDRFDQEKYELFDLKKQKQLIKDTQHHIDTVDRKEGIQALRENPELRRLYLEFAICRITGLLQFNPFLKYRLAIIAVAMISRVLLLIGKESGKSFLQMISKYENEWKPKRDHWENQLSA